MHPDETVEFLVSMFLITANNFVVIVLHKRLQDIFPN